MPGGLLDLLNLSLLVLFVLNVHVYDGYVICNFTHHGQHAVLMSFEKLMDAHRSACTHTIRDNTVCECMKLIKMLKCLSTIFVPYDIVSCNINIT